MVSINLKHKPNKQHKESTLAKTSTEQISCYLYTREKSRKIKKNVIELVAENSIEMKKSVLLTFSNIYPEFLLFSR